MTGACSIVSKLYLTAALLALAGLFTSVEHGDVFADLMQNFLAQAPDHSGDSERLDCVTSSEQIVTASNDLLHYQWRSFHV